MSPVKIQKFYLWFVPLVIVFGAYSFYLMTLSHIPYKLGISHLFNPQKEISIANADINIMNNAAVVLELKPGENAVARARIRNLTNHDASIDIFPLDAVKQFGLDEPGFKLESKSAPLDQLGSWIELPKSVLQIPKHKEEFVEFQVSVSAGTESGNYAGGVAIEESDATDGDIIVDGQVRVKKRYALRVYVEVTDTPQPKMYKTWEERLQLHNRLFVLHSAIIITNLIILLVLFAVFSPKVKR